MDMRKKKMMKMKKDENTQADFMRSFACGKCNFVGKTEPGLKTHVTVKHKELDKN